MKLHLLLAAFLALLSGHSIAVESKPNVIVILADDLGYQGFEHAIHREAGIGVALPLGCPQGVKFDLVQVLDLDADGDLDVITCEERDQFGVIWYENPQAQSPVR